MGFPEQFNDYFGVYNGSGRNNPTFGLGRDACGKCLSLISSQLQYVKIDTTPYIDLRPISFSVEAWIKPNIVSDGVEHVVFGQCPALSTRQCMRTGIAGGGVMTFPFRSDNTVGSKMLPVNVWFHVAYVYNRTALSMALYYNGALDTLSASHGPFEGQPYPLEIGNVANYNPSTNLSFSGCIDEIWFYPFARKASDIAATVALG